MARPLGICYYCGAPGTTRDHIIPRSLTRTTKWVHACVLCNCILGTVPIYTPEGRAAYLYGAIIYTTRHRKRYTIEQLEHMRAINL